MKEQISIEKNKINTHARPHQLVDRTAFIATMHQKEAIIAPLLEQALGLKCEISQTFDTDVFGTFTGEVKRPASQLETLRMKCNKGLEMSGLDICIASEGAFGAHPDFPFLPADIEMVMLVDTKYDLEIVGEILSAETNFAKEEVSSWEEALQFATQIGFPEHALVVGLSGNSKEKESGEFALPFTVAKGVKEIGELQEIVSKLLQTHQSIHLETDMRAMNNPTRQKVIRQATEQVIRKLLSACPQCGTLGFGATEVRLGLPCENCGLPTQEPIATIWQCVKCNFSKEEMYPKGYKEASAIYCYFCNP